jgi:hypothetical protein
MFITIIQDCCAGCSGTGGAVSGVCSDGTLHYSYLSIAHRCSAARTASQKPAAGDYILSVSFFLKIRIGDETAY